MRNFITFLILLSLSLGSCKKHSKHVKVSGKVEHVRTGNGVSNVEIELNTQSSSPGIFGSITTVHDTKTVITDENGNFSVRMKTEKESSVAIKTEGKDDFYCEDPRQTFSYKSDIIIPAIKWVDTRIHVKNVNPYDENDWVQVRLWANLDALIEFQKVEDYGSEYKGISLISGEFARWEGTDINSTIYFKMTEDVIVPEILWKTRKNGVEKEGRLTIPNFDPDKVNEYTFEF